MLKRVGSGWFSNTISFALSKWNLVINCGRQVPTSLLIPHLDQQSLVPIIIDIIAKWCIGQKQDSCNDLLLFFPGRFPFSLGKGFSVTPNPQPEGLGDYSALVQQG